MGPTDRELLASWLHTLNQGDFVALQPSPGRITQSAGHEDAAEVAARRGIEDPDYVFWHAQSEDAFDLHGSLVRELMLNWGGDHERVASALASCPAPFEVVDNGPRGAFGIRIPATRSADVGDPADVKRRLSEIHQELNESPETARRWLHAVVASPLREVRLDALVALADHVQTEQLEAFATELKQNIDAVDRRDELVVVDKLVRVLSRLRGTPAYSAVLDQLRAERTQLYQAATVRLVGLEPWSAANEAELRVHLDTPFLAVGYTAARDLVRTRSVRDGVSREAAALALADDLALSPEGSERMFRLACSERGYRVRGCLALAEDESMPTAVRSRALEHACGYLRFKRSPEAVARVDALVEAGLQVDDELLSSVRRD